jgi:hypothetical protein
MLVGITGFKQVNIKLITDTMHGRNKHGSGPASRKYVNYRIYAQPEALCPRNAGSRRHDIREFTLIPVHLL